jgi:hypothetical protein
MYDMAEFLFQESLVLCSITLLLKAKTHFRVGLTVSIGATAALGYAFLLL